MDPIAEDPFPRESVVLETEAAISVADPEMTTPTVKTDEPKVPNADLPVELSHP